jgi:hypothetical protein
MQFKNDEYQADIIQKGDKFVLTCTDYLMNEWREEFFYMHEAVMRLGLLIEAVESNRAFSNSPQVFAKDLKAFTNSQLGGN